MKSIGAISGAHFFKTTGRITFHPQILWTFNLEVIAKTNDGVVRIRLSIDSVLVGKTG